LRFFSTCQPPVVLLDDHGLQILARYYQAGRPVPVDLPEQCDQIGLERGLTVGVERREGLWTGP
jgi:hypothetical protein